MTATDEQIARVKDYMLHGCLNDEYSEALAAVLSELTELRRKVTDQANSLRHAAEEATAYKHDAKIDAERIDKMAAELATLRELRDAVKPALSETLECVDECYKTTGHIKVAKGSIQREKIEQAIAALAKCPQPARNRR